MRIKTQLTTLAMALTVATGGANAAIHTEIFDGGTTLGSTGSITFDDWGFTGPNGRTATDFSQINGFGNGTYNAGTADYCINNPAACGIGQVQHVVTSGPDMLTPDDPAYIKSDPGGTNTYVDANVDSMATFYEWGYTSNADSTFNNMLIDFDGDYQIAKDDMSFSFYNTIEYQQEGTSGTVADGTYNNFLAFQPYALSDATGWCGSVLASHPNAHEAMAGQVTFDFAFDVYFRTQTGFLIYSSTEIVRGFEMRSYGELTLDITTEAGIHQQMNASAVINNTDPTATISSVDANTPTGDPELWHNKVSFMGGDVVTTGSAESIQADYDSGAAFGEAVGGDCGLLTAEFAAGQTGIGIKKFDSLIDGITDAAACTTAGGTWQAHAYSGYGFILRADAERFVDYFDEGVYGADPMVAAVPVPAAVWLFGSGLIGLVGVARRKAA